MPVNCCFASELSLVSDLSYIFNLLVAPQLLNSLAEACTDEPAPAPLSLTDNVSSHHTVRLLHALGLGRVFFVCRYKEDKVGLRWRTEKDVVSGKVTNNVEGLQLVAT